MSSMRSAALHLGLQRFIDTAQDRMREDDTVAAKLETDFASELALCLHEDNLSKTMALIAIRDIVRETGRASDKLERIQDVIESLPSPL